MSDKMTDAEVRAELERVMGFETSDYFDTLSILDGLKKEEDATGGKKYWLNFHYKYLRLLAELNKALGEIIEINNDEDLTFRESFDKIDVIARTHHRGGYEGPKSEPTVPVSLKCKCGYVLKPQDKSCPQCEKLFGQKGGSNG